MAIIKIGNPAIDLDAAEIPNLSANKITSDTLADARIPANALNSNIDLTNLSASNLTSGTVATARLGSGTADATTFLRGDNTFNAPPLGGITQADVLYYSGSTSFADGQQNTFSSWTRRSNTGYGKIGSGVTQSSGIFTLPATGIYLIQAHWYLYVGQDVTFITTNIYGTENNGSSWTNMSSDDTSVKQVVGQTYCPTQQFAQFDCTNTSTHKIYTSSYGTQAYSVGNGQSNTYISFIRLGDT